MTDLTLYLVDAEGYDTGQVLIADPMAAQPPGAVLADPPPLASYGEFVRWTGDDWLLTDQPPSDLRVATALAAQLRAAEAHYNQVAQEPVAWDFGLIEGKDDHGVSTGPAGLQTLQMRVDPVAGKNDPQNWLAALSGAQLAIVLGAPNTLTPLKTTANVWVQTTALQAATVLALGDGSAKPSMLQIGRQRLARFGQIKAQLVAAAESEGATAADVLAIDVTDYGA